MTDKKEEIEKKLTKSKADLEKEKTQLQTVVNQIQAYQKKIQEYQKSYGEHGLKMKQLEARIEAFEEMLNE